ncbi:MAG: RlmE family RNA methyltransferase [Methanomassiliicoccales archaeon]
MSKRWLAERKKDPYYKAAKKMDYRSRASFKLMQIDDKFRILKPGYTVADLGAAPGGWLQVAVQRVGKNGKVVGVDLQPIEPLDGAVTIQGDMRKEETVSNVLETIGGKADVVLSDMSPNISGNYSMDHARSVDLCEHALKFAVEVLKPGGTLVMKVFEGDMMQDLMRKVKSVFNEVRLYGPEASRASSSEIYIIARGFRAKEERGL